jgi:hypothetical protein
MPAADWLSLSVLPGIVVSSGLGAIVMCLLVLRYGFAPLHENATDETPTDAGRRLIITRLGHAVAGFCFAASAILAVIAMVQQPRALIGQPLRGGARDAAMAPRHTDVDRVRRELAALEERLGRAESAARTVENRLGQDESARKAEAARVDAIDARMAAAEGFLRQVEGDASRALAGLKQLEQRVAVAQPASAPPHHGSRRSDVATGRASSPAPSVIAREPSSAPSLSPAGAPAPASTPPGAAESWPSSPPMPSAAPNAHNETSPRVAKGGERTEASPPPQPSGGLVDKFRGDWKVIKREAEKGGDEIRNAFRKVRDFLTQ